MSGALRNGIQWFQVKRNDYELDFAGDAKWSNRDVLPVPPEQRRFTIFSYISFWAICSASTTAWTYGGTLLAIGLSAAQGIGCIVVSTAFIAALAYLCGHPGSHKNLGFTALARTSFGLYGSYLPVLLLVFENVIFFGINGYFGGLSAVIFIGAMSPGYKNMRNTLPERQSLTFGNAGLTTQELIGFVVYIVIFLAMLPIHSSKFRRLVWPAAVGIVIVFFGLFGWAIGVNHGTPGSLLVPTKELSPTARSFAMLYGISTTAGSGTAYSSRMSDWTRFSKTKDGPAPALLAAPLIFGVLTTTLGILATNAVHTRYGVLEWNPLAMLLYVQEKHYTSAGRAATFFAGSLLFLSLLLNNLMGKIIPAGMDCAGLFPRFITTRRGSVILSVIGILIQPWRFVTEPATFVKVLSSFGVFVSPLTGILAVDYWLVSRRKWRIPDIFRQDGLYWYTLGVNWRAVAALLLSIVFSMPGFVAYVRESDVAVGWTRIYQMSYIVNIAIATSVYYGLSWAFPPASSKYQGDWDADVTESIHSQGEATKQEEPAVLLEYAQPDKRVTAHLRTVCPDS